MSDAKTKTKCANPHTEEEQTKAALEYISSWSPIFKRASIDLGYDLVNELISRKLVRTYRIPGAHWSYGGRLLGLTDEGFAVICGPFRRVEHKQTKSRHKQATLSV